MKYPKIIQIFILLNIFHSQINAQTPFFLDKVITSKKIDNTVVLHCPNNRQLKITIEQDDIVRFQCGTNGAFAPSIMINQGLVKNDFTNSEFSFRDNGALISISTKKMVLKINKKPFNIALFDSKSNLLTSLETIKGDPKFEKANKLMFKMAEDEHFYGFGFMRAGFDARGLKLKWTKNYRWREATVPFFMSTHNYGFFSNNTWDHNFDFTGKDAKTSFFVENSGGSLDFYLFAGDNFKQIIKTYATLTGFPMMAPNWAIGLQYRCRYMESQKNVIQIASEFRKHHIPIDIIGLEPGWENDPYGNKLIWSAERFPEPAKMIADLKKTGFHFDLWESGTAPTKNILEQNVLDNWYAKRLSLLDLGVESFKQDDPYPRDITSQAYDPAVSSDNYLSSGVYKHPELNNIANSIFSNTAFNYYRKYTGKRTFIQFHAYNASVASQRWPYQWGGDFLSGTGMLNAGLSGHSVVSEDMRDFSPKGLHYSFLTPAPVMDAWAYFREPWCFPEEVERSERFYSSLRQKLSPYLYATLWQSHTDAIPMMRAMVLEYPQDTNTYQMQNQFMLGDWLLVVAKPSVIDESDRAQFVGKELSTQAYLPKGQWINYWTGETYQAETGNNKSISWPSYAGGGLLVKAGAIIPTTLVNQFAGEHPLVLVGLEIYPYGETSYTLHEDDGVTYKYEENEFAATTFTVNKSQDLIVIKTNGRQGTYNGMIKNRYYLLKVHSSLPPIKVEASGKVLNEVANKSALLYNNASGWYFDKGEQRIYIKQDAAWKLLKNNDRFERNNSLNYELDSIAYNRDHIGGDNLNILVKLDSRPTITAKFEQVNLPANNKEGTYLELSKIHFNDGPIKNLNDITLNLSGPSHFKSGAKTIKLNAVDLPLRIPVYSEKQTGITHIIADPTVRCISDTLISSGSISKIDVLSLNKFVLADGISVCRFKVELKDVNNNPLASDQNVKIKINKEGGKFNQKLNVKNGEGYFEVKSDKSADLISVVAESKGIRSNICQQPITIGYLKMTTNPQEEVILNNGGVVDWLKPKVDVFVRFVNEGITVHSINSRAVTLKVYNEDHVLLKEYQAIAKDGEAIFKEVDYYSRPGKCFFVASADGYEKVEIKIFENTWDYKMVDKRLEKK